MASEPLKPHGLLTHTKKVVLLSNAPSIPCKLFLTLKAKLGVEELLDVLVVETAWTGYNKS